MCGSSGNTQAPPPKPATKFTEVPRDVGTTMTQQPGPSAAQRNPNVISSTDDQKSNTLGA